MKIPIKTKLAFWWWYKFQYKKPANIVQKISNNGVGLKSLLFILPKDKTQLAIALHFLKSLSAHGNLDVIGKIIGYTEYKDKIIPELMDRMDFIIKDDTNRYGLLTVNSLKRLTKGEYKGIINLDPESEPISQQIVANFSTEIRIGFNSESTADLYNISIENDHTNNYVEKGYKYILEVLGL